MPTYIFKCVKCGEIKEVNLTMDQIRDINNPPKIQCSECLGGFLSRDYPSENAISTFHPTKDLYATSLRQRKSRNNDYS